MVKTAACGLKVAGSLLLYDIPFFVGPKTFHSLLVYIYIYIYIYIYVCVCVCVCVCALE